MKQVWEIPPAESWDSALLPSVTLSLIFQHPADHHHHDDAHEHHGDDDDNDGTYYDDDHGE